MGNVTSLDKQKLLEKAVKMGYIKDPPSWLATPTAALPASRPASVDVDHDEVEGEPFFAVNEYPTPMDEAAYYGLPGDIVRAIEPHTEADPVALLMQVLVAYGNVIGRVAHSMAEATPHFCNEFVGLVGETSKGRKGTSWGHIKRIFEAVDEGWIKNRVQGGLSSGEGMMWAVRDKIITKVPRKEKGKGIVGYDEITQDEGVIDKRLLAYESELASVLRVCQRDGNTLSQRLRDVWDCKEILQTMTKSSPVKATKAYISIIGHITKDELKRYMNRSELAGGLANRFLWVAVRRSKYLPEGGGQVDYDPLVHRLREAVEFGKAMQVPIRRDDAAKEVWARVYPQLSDGKPGLFGAAIARAEAHTMRLSVIYALMDQSPVVRVEHLRAALAVWRYAEETAHWIWGDAQGDEVADTLTEALREAGERGLTRTEISQLFGRNLPKKRIEQALDGLLSAKVVRMEMREPEGKGKRKKQVWLINGKY